LAEDIGREDLNWVFKSTTAGVFYWGESIDGEVDIYLFETRVGRKESGSLEELFLRHIVPFETVLVVAKTLFARLECGV